MAAPTATTSSGLTPLCGSFPKMAFTFSWTAGIRVEPPTRTTSSMSDGTELRVGERLLARAGRALDQILDERLELRPGQLHRQVLGTGRVGRDERQVDVGLERGRQLALGLLRGLLEALERHGVAAKVDAVLAS